MSTRDWLCEPWMKPGPAYRGRSDGEIADTHVHTNNFGELLAGWLCYVNEKGHKQIERLLLPVIPELRVTDGGSLPYQGDMLVIALVGDADASVEGADADLLMALKGVVTLIGVLHRRGTVVWWLVQALKAFFRDLGPAMLHILLELFPEPDVG